MTCVKRYSCDLCRRDISQETGIGIKWGVADAISATFYANSEHHLCTECVKGLRSMLRELDETTEMYRRLDTTEETEV